MSANKEKSRWIVGGPGRCGKTHLVLSLWRYKGPVAGFPLEGLFTVYGRRRVAPARQAIRALLAEYLTRPRYTDAIRQFSKRPIEYYSSSVEALCRALPVDRSNPVSMIGWALDVFAEEHGSDGWAAFDLHPEFRYPIFRRLIPGLKLAVMTRDAREATCAALYWRGDPGHGAARDARFKHRLILYCLGLQTAEVLARQWPSDVQLFSFNALVAGDSMVRQRVAEFFGVGADVIDAAYELKPHFQFSPGSGFLLPNGCQVMLLEAGELREISVLTGCGEHDLPDRSVRVRWRFILFARLLLLLGRFVPRLARATIDFVYYPAQYVRRCANSTRQLVSDLGIGFRNISMP